MLTSDAVLVERLIHAADVARWAALTGPIVDRARRNRDADLIMEHLRLLALAARREDGDGR